MLAAGEAPVVADGRSAHSISFEWTITSFSTLSRKLYSPYVEVAGNDCRLEFHPKGLHKSLPGHSALFIQIVDPRNSKRDCFASYKLQITNQLQKSKSVRKEGIYRFSGKRRLHGWFDFVLSSTLSDSKSGFLSNDSLLITADVCVLDESFSVTRDNNHLGSCEGSDVLSGKIAWTFANFRLVTDVMKKQKISSPTFLAGKYDLFVSAYVSPVNGVDHFCLCLEAKETDFTLWSSSCWYLFRVSVLSQKPGVSHKHWDSYGRFEAEGRGFDNLNLRWSCMKMSEFIRPDSAFLVDGKVEITISYHLFKELSSFSKNVEFLGGPKKHDWCAGKITWKIHHFTKLKELLKKRKIKGFYTKSPIYQIGDRNCRLVVYPRGRKMFILTYSRVFFS